MMRRAAPQGDAPDHDPSQDADAPPKPSSPKKQGPAAPTCDSDPDENFQSAVEEQELPFNVNSMVLLSKGGFGAAYYARLKNNQSVVLKVARVGEDGSRGVAASEVWDAFETELTFYEAMSDAGGKPWLPEYYGTGLLNGAPWLVLERLSASLHVLNAVGEGARLFRRLALGMLSALQSLHDEGYIHRDVKLENFCVRQTRTAPLQVCLIDFGLVMDYATHADGIKEDAFEPFLGTYNYASDRQLREVVLGRADDIECLGYALLELYLGTPWWKIFRTQKKAAPAPAPLADEGKKRTRGDAAADVSGPSKDPGTVIGSANPRPRRQARAAAAAAAGEAQPPAVQAVLRLVPLGEGATSSVGHGRESKGAVLPKTESLGNLSTEPAAPVPSHVAKAGSGGALAATVAAAAPGGGAVTEVDSLQQLRTSHMTACERFNATIQLRTAVFERLQKQGGMPQFLADWLSYAKSLSAFDAPNYAFLQSLLENAPESAPRPAFPAPATAGAGAAAGSDKAPQQRRAAAAMRAEE